MIKEKKAQPRLFINKELERLTRDLELEISSGLYPTTDQQHGLINNMKEAFFKAIVKTYTSKIIIKEKDSLDLEKQNNIVKSISSDISGAYNRTSDSQTDFQNKLNRFDSFKRELQDRISRANSVIQNTSILNDIGVFEIGDSFGDLSRIDSDDPGSINQMFQVLTGGILTLPREKTDNIEPVEILVMDSSNGFSVDKKGIANIYDNNEDTWFEYRREGIDKDDSFKLNVDILVKLKLPVAVNLIKITPLITDDKSFPKIESIETSLDGRFYQNIDNSMPSSITREEEESIFTLGPVGFRNQSYSEFIITPRVCQFIKIRIKQSKKTMQENGEFHQIIALRDISIQQVHYNQEGEILTKPLPLPFFAKRALVSQRAAPTEPLTTIAYQISLDGGATYAPMLIDTPLDINTGTPTSISVDGQKREARLRLTAVRNAENFNGISAPLASEVKTIKEAFSSTRTPFNFTLQSLPIEDSIKIFEPLAKIGGKDKGNLLSLGSGQGKLAVKIPVAIKELAETIRVNGSKWERVSNFSNSDPDANHYKIDYINSEITFGDNTQGNIPESDIRIQIEPEKIVIQDTSPFISTLEYSHGFNKEEIIVEWKGEAAKVNKEQLYKDSKVHNLKNKDIVETIKVREEVPKDTASFILKHIPKNLSILKFDDTEIFQDGEFSASAIVANNKFSPIKITSNKKTSKVSPGFVEYEAIAKIINIRDTYNIETYSESELDIYIPKFDSDLFNFEKEFSDGAMELTKSGDYSIDYKNGVVYSFSNTQVDLGVAISYKYIPSKEVAWGFGSKSNSIVLDDESILLNKNDFEQIVLEKDDNKYFVVYKDSRFIWMPFKKSYLKNPEEVVDTLGLASAYKPLQRTSPDVNFNFTPKDDFIKGQVLPAGKRKVKLNNSQIVKNSVKFIFLSDNTNSINDRIVSKNSLGQIIIENRPVKDVYGDSIEVLGSSSETQRDYDSKTISKEVEFIDGRTEINSGGEYSIDYKNGWLYTYDSVPAYTIIQYEFSNISVSYMAHNELEEREDFETNIKNLEVTINKPADSLSNNGLIAKYDIIENFLQDPSKIVNFYTPILYGYKLKISKG